MGEGGGGGGTRISLLQFPPELGQNMHNIIPACQHQVCNNFYLSDCIIIHLIQCRIQIFSGGPAPRHPLEDTLYVILHLPPCPPPPHKKSCMQPCSTFLPSRPLKLIVIKDLQPTTPVLKAGHPASCSSLCCMLCIVWFRGFWVPFFSIYCFLASVQHTFFHVYTLTCTC